MRGLKRALPFVIILLACSMVCVMILFFDINRETLYISHESGIYSGSFDLSLFSYDSETIIYTTDGQKPQLGEDGTYEYNKPIEIECGNETTTYSFQICCVYEDGSLSDVYKRDYILDPLGEERFTTNYVVSITGNEEMLFGDESGIFVRGTQFYDYLAEHPDANVLDGPLPANYYMDIEVPVHAAFFLGDGTPIIEQECGIKIYGNVTRQSNQKSFRLYARYEYDDSNEFSYPFFHDLLTEGGQAPIEDWQRLSFHNSGNDNDYAYVRTELVGALARQSGFPDTLGAESVTVYINGKYQGVYWLQNSFDERYFKEKYGEYIGEMVVCEGSLGTLNVDEAETAAEVRCCNDYNDFLSWLEIADLNDDANWQRVCETIDVENFAHYFALQYYTGNFDWPQNNVKVYRYECGDGENYREDTIFDGRYRFLLFDTDYSLGLIFLGLHGRDVSVTRMNSFLTTNIDTVLFRALSQRQEFRDLYSAKIMYLINVIFTRDNMSNTLYNLNVTRYDELNYMITQTDILEGSIWEEYGVGLGDMTKTEVEWEKILQYAAQRPQYIIQELQEEWGYGKVIILKVSANDMDNIRFNDMSVGNTFDGIWLNGVPVEISCDLSVGMVVEGYMINSDYVEGESLLVTAEVMEKYGDEINITPVISVEETQSLAVIEYNIQDSQDYIILQNNGTVDLNLQEYALADGEDSISGSMLPAVQLSPGEKYYVYGDKYVGEMEENGTQVAFSWNDQEQIYLYHEIYGFVVY